MDLDRPFRGGLKPPSVQFAWRHHIGGAGLPREPAAEVRVPVAPGVHPAPRDLPIRWQKRNAPTFRLPPPLHLDDLQGSTHHRLLGRQGIHSGGDEACIVQSCAQGLPIRHVLRMRADADESFQQGLQDFVVQCLRLQWHHMLHSAAVLQDELALLLVDGRHQQVPEQKLPGAPFENRAEDVAEALLHSTFLRQHLISSLRSLNSRRHLGNGGPVAEKQKHDARGVVSNQW
mmetsp:Transcript_19649/g.55026  ORF Transcript_19649/g.55026 Transcript_19649/m.55026 type:complete len:231 (-) Transcript_19649:826-1518(-)